MGGEALRSKADPDWQTPPEVVALVHRVFPRGFLDPCTAPNNPTGALAFLTKEADGLTSPWGRMPVFCNPPGGLVKEFWRKVVDHRRPTLWLGFNLNQLAYLEPSPLEYTTIVLRWRLKFWRDGKPGKNPTHHNYVTLLNFGLWHNEAVALVKEFNAAPRPHRRRSKRGAPGAPGPEGAR